MKKVNLRKYCQKTKIPRIDAVRRYLSDFDLEGFKDMHTDIIKTTIKNKLFRSGTLDGVTVGSDPHIILGQ
ncbi:hypothetical protein LL033_16415 [Clostridium estertheticum]|uniref:hypothetical protein n=1 Tax=Clostridium estertheticum TaxID=238834 RepID=UPI00209A6643|nr:hypothetical protein [Clostridium estertheticum]WAG54209.1 hypothetical protein LL033_16415 [Clostridium estertheticum]